MATEPVYSGRIPLILRQWWAAMGAANIADERIEASEKAACRLLGELGSNPVENSHLHFLAGRCLSDAADFLIQNRAADESTAADRSFGTSYAESYLAGRAREIARGFQLRTEAIQHYQECLRYAAGAELRAEASSRLAHEGMAVAQNAMDQLPTGIAPELHKQTDDAYWQVWRDNITKDPNEIRAMLLRDWAAAHPQKGLG